jgi:hypothetical protein
MGQQQNNFKGLQQWYEVKGVIETTVCNGLTRVTPNVIDEVSLKSMLL